MSSETSSLSKATPVLGGAHAWFVWTIAVIFVVYLFNAQTGYAVLNPMVQADLGLSLSETALVASVYTWAFAVSQLFGGAMLDRLGSKKVIVTAVVLVAIGVLLFGTAHSFATLLLSQLVVALGSSVGFVGAGYVGGKWFGMAKFGVMFGLVQVVASLSSALGQSAISAALDFSTWREIVLFGGFCGIGLTVLAFLFVRDPVPPAATRGNLFVAVLKGIGEVLRVPHVWICAIWGALTFGGQLALGVVWAPRLLEAHGVSAAQAVYAAAAAWLGLAIGCLFWSTWSDRIGSRKIPSVVGNVLQLASMAGLIFLPVNFLLGILLLFLYGMGNAAHITAFTTAAEAVPGRLIGTSASVVNGTMFLIGGILIDVPGRLLDGTDGSLGAYQSAFLPLLGLLVVAVVLSALMRETFGKSG